MSMPAPITRKEALALLNEQIDQAQDRANVGTSNRARMMARAEKMAYEKARSIFRAIADPVARGSRTNAHAMEITGALGIALDDDHTPEVTLSIRITAGPKAMVGRRVYVPTTTGVLHTFAAVNNAAAEDRS
jgi:hypothetical protein